MAYPLDNADRVETGRLPSDMSSFWVTCTHTEVPSSLKQNTDLAYQCSNQSVEITIQGYKVDKGQVLDIPCHASRPAVQVQECSFAETMYGMFEHRSNLNSIAS